MDILLNEVSKRFRKEWVFKNVSTVFQSKGSYAILGPNGSGKSTLLRTISGHLSPTRGKVVFQEKSKQVPLSEAYKFISFGAPYIELIEEFTLQEALDFHHKFRRFKNGLKTSDLIALLGFQRSATKEIRNFSSGMKQRLRLVLALCSESEIVLLDEPTTNLDRQGVTWYKELIEKFASDRLIIVASNVEEDMEFCQERFSVSRWKPS